MVHCSRIFLYCIFLYRIFPCSIRLHSRKTVPCKVQNLPLQSAVLFFPAGWSLLFSVHWYRWPVLSFLRHSSVWHILPVSYSRGPKDGSFQIHRLSSPPLLTLWTFRHPVQNAGRTVIRRCVVSYMVSASFLLYYWHMSVTLGCSFFRHMSITFFKYLLLINF